MKFNMNIMLLEVISTPIYTGLYKCEISVHSNSLIIGLKNYKP